MRLHPPLERVGQAQGAPGERDGLDVHGPRCAGRQGSQERQSAPRRLSRLVGGWFRHLRNGDGRGDQGAARTVGCGRRLRDVAPARQAPVHVHRAADCRHAREPALLGRAHDGVLRVHQRSAPLGLARGMAQQGGICVDRPARCALRRRGGGRDDAAGTRARGRPRHSHAVQLAALGPRRLRRDIHRQGRHPARLRLPLR